MFDLGLKKPTPDDIRQRIAEAVETRVGDVNVDRSSLLGQIIDVVADEAALAYEYAEAAFLASNATTATGVALRAHALSRGVTPIDGSEPLHIAFAEGVVPDTFSANGKSYRVVSRSEGRYAYARDSVRLDSRYPTEAAVLTASQGRILGSVIVHRNTSASSFRTLPALGFSDLSIVYLDSRLESDLTADGYRLFVSGFSTASTSGETDEQLRRRIADASKQTVGGTVTGIENALAQAGIAATVTANHSLQPFANGQPPQTIHVQIHDPSKANREVDTAIYRARPAGIPSWGAILGTTYGEMWSVATSHEVTIRVFGVSLTSGSLDRSAVETIIRREIAAGATHGGKIAAAVISGVANVLDVTITLNGQSSIVRDSRAVVVKGFEYA